MPLRCNVDMDFRSDEKGSSCFLGNCFSNFSLRSPAFAADTINAISVGSPIWPSNSALFARLPISKMRVSLLVSISTLSMTNSPRGE